MSELVATVWNGGQSNSLRVLQIVPKRAYQKTGSELLVRDPTNDKYIYQQFMANFNLANELDSNDIADWRKSRTKFLETADAMINSLLLKAPDNPIYLDARNSLDLTLAKNSKSSATWSESLLKQANASSKLVWEKIEINRNLPNMPSREVQRSQVWKTTDKTSGDRYEFA